MTTSTLRNEKISIGHNFQNFTLENEVDMSFLLVQAHIRTPNESLKLPRVSFFSNYVVKFCVALTFFYRGLVQKLIKSYVNIIDHHYHII